MRERPILFSGPMVCAILAGTKTQTRRPVKLNASGRAYLSGRNWHLGDPKCVKACPYGQPGDRLWVRETFRPFPPCTEAPNLWNIVYGADADQVEREAPKTYRPMLYNYERWSPSIHMPRWACRIVLKITNVRVERLQEISEQDATAEGAKWDARMYPMSFYFKELWDSVYSAKGRGWAANPWVWVVEFRRVSATEAK